MKKVLTTAILTIGTVFGFAQEAIQEPAINTNALPLEVKPSLPLDKKVSPKNSMFYLRMAVTDSQPVNTIDSVKVLPGLGLGYRFGSGASLLDLSASYNARVWNNGVNTDTYFYTAPKINYLYQFSPEKNSTFYVGGGAAFGGLKTKDAREFMGLIPNAAVGYEFNRSGTISTFVQLDVSQPAIAVARTGDFPGAFAELSLGAGF